MTYPEKFTQYIKSISVWRLAWLAFHTGSLVAIQYKSSQRSPSRASFAAYFSEYARALAYAKSANVYGIRVAVKRSTVGGYAVTVPAPRPYSRLPRTAGQLINCRVQVDHFSAVLARSGLSQIADIQATS